MKNLLFVRIPSTCICFTLIILATVLSSLLCGADAPLYPLLLFGWIIVCQIVDWLFSFINFKSWLQYCLIESVVLYAASLAAALLFGWISFTPHGLVLFTLIFWVTDIFIFRYFKRRNELLAEEINAML